MNDHDYWLLRDIGWGGTGFSIMSLVMGVGLAKSGIVDSLTNMASQVSNTPYPAYLFYLPTEIGAYVSLPCILLAFFAGHVLIHRGYARFMFECHGSGGEKAAKLAAGLPEEGLR